jgi:hypothetical protein
MVSRLAQYERLVTLDRGAMVAVGEDIADVPLGFEIKMGQRKKGVEVVVKAVSPEGLASRTGPESQLKVGDRLLEINGTKLSSLPAGAAGRIYLFRLLAASVVRIKARTTKTVIGTTDPVSGDFVPLKKDANPFGENNHIPQ